MMISPETDTSLEQAVGAASAAFGAMGTSEYWVLVSNVGLWLAQGAAPTASAGAGSMYWPANTPLVLDGRAGAKVAVIDDGTAGKCSLTRVLLF